MATQVMHIDTIEAALVSGDLSRLDPPGRIQFYNQVCQSLGLNPLTQPFAYITLNGKLQLYAKKDCTEQLRRVYGVSVTKLEKDKFDDVYVVTAYVKDKTGREDSSTGAVPVGGVKGEALANALMKAETKAKRRATLSICGLGILDESELETIPEVKHFKEVEEVPQPRIVSPSPKPEPQTTLIQQLEASLEQEGYSFSVTGDRITCKPVDVLEKKAKNGAPCMSVILDQDVDGFGSAFCYSQHLFPALRLAKEKVLVFTGERKKFLHVADVLSVDGHEYREGVPVNAESTEPLITIEDIPF